MATPITSPTPSALPPIPSSPTYSYASTANPLSQYNLPAPPPPLPPHAVLTKADLEASQTAYTDLLSSAKSYRLALATLSSASSTFGSALEACARLKEARSPSVDSSASNMSNSFSADSGSCTADSLLAASGVHQLIANHLQILSETVYRSFEVPLLSETDSWRRRIEEEEERYVKEAKGMSKEIRKMEKEGVRMHGKRKRDVGALREHLVKLTGKLDGLTGLHGGHARGLLREGQEISGGVAECCAGLVRAEVDIFEALARKGWSGGGLDELLERGRDLFANEDGVGVSNNAKIFSILPQKSILVDSPTNESGRPPHHRSDSLLVEGTTYQSLAGAVRDTDVNSLFSERDTVGILNRPRGARPFSPPPMERIPVLERDPLELGRPEARAEEEDGELGPASPSTMVLVSPPVEDGDREREERERSDGGSESSEVATRKERERRWSVTDDGVASE